MATWVILAVAATVLLAWAQAAWVDVLQAPPASAQALEGGDLCTVSRWQRPGATYVVSVRNGTGWNWSPHQATGAPDTPAPGDQVTAWASATPDGAREWLCLDYASAVLPKAVRVYETYGPGALDRVTVFTADGQEVDAWHGADPTPTNAGMGTSEVPLSVDFPVKKVKIHLNSPAVAGWNEIDAAGLVDRNDHVQWAQRATASSTYGSSPMYSSNPGAVAALLPGYGNLERGRSDAHTASARVESRAIDLRGWPLPALWCERDPTTGGPTAGALGTRGAGGIAYSATVPSLALGGNVASMTRTTGTFGRSIAYTSGSFTSTISSAANAPAVLRPALPYRIAWAGFCADVGFYATAFAALGWLLTRPFHFVVELSRVRQGRCIACGYDLGYDFLRGCSECGWRRGEGARA